MTIIEFVPFYFSASIAINLLCAAVVLSSGFKQYKPVYKSLFIACLIAVAYQYATWHYHRAINVEQSLFWLRCQTSIVIAGLPMYMLIFLQWGKQKISPVWLKSITVFCFFYLLYNLTSDYTIRFTSDLKLVEYSLFSNETVTRLTGTANQAGVGFHIFGLSVLLFLTFLAVKLYRQSKIALATILVVILVLQVASTGLAILIDIGVINFFYIGGLPFTILNVIACMTIATSLQYKSKSLDSEKDLRENLEAVFEGVAKGISGANTEEFYSNMMLELSKLSGARMAYIGIVSDVASNRIVTTKAVIQDNQQLENFSYSLNNIPDDLISTQDMVVARGDLHKKYPHLQLFKKFNAHTFVNMPMINDQRAYEGSIMLIFDTHVNDDHLMFQTLDIFASRAASEIQRSRLQNEIVKVAYYDQQTRLPNLAYLHESLDKQSDFNQLEGKQSALLIIDLKGFTDINRNLGFEQAELLMRNLGEKLQDYVSHQNLNQHGSGKIDTKIEECAMPMHLFRAGGNEFAIIINDVVGHSSGIVKAHWRTLHSIVCSPIEVAFQNVSLQCNAGAVVFPEQTNSKDDIKRAAETALQEAKNKNKNDLQLFDSSVLEKQDERAKLINLLHEQTQTPSELSAVYQPKVSPSGDLVGAEALIRWHSSTLGFVSPFEFIGVAEEVGLIEPIGNWMIDTVCQQINKWKTQGLVITGRVAINVSAIQLAQQDFVETISDITQKHNITPQQIEIELTESGLLTNLDDCFAKLERLRSMGFSVALDDFGTGYSSLSYLTDLPLDVLKIDRSFVNKIHEEKANKLAQSIVSIGQHMALSIVAEGVEELTQVEQLHAMGCQVFQGYYFAKPLNDEEFLVWAQAKNESGANHEKNQKIVDRES